MQIKTTMPYTSPAPGKDNMGNERVTKNVEKTESSGIGGGYKMVQSLLEIKPVTLGCTG